MGTLLHKLGLNRTSPNKCRFGSTMRDQRDSVRRQFILKVAGNNVGMKPESNRKSVAWASPILLLYTLPYVIFSNEFLRR